MELVCDQTENPYTEVFLLQGHADIVRLLLKLDHTRFVSVGDDNIGIVWDVKTGRKLCTLSGHSRPITCVCLLVHAGEDGEVTRLLTGSSDKNIKLWDVDSGECLQTLVDHRCSVKCLLSLDEGRLFCSGGDNLSVWSNGGQLLAQSDRSDSDDVIYLMIHIHNNRLVTAAGRKLAVYSIQTNQTTEMMSAMTSEMMSEMTIGAELVCLRKLPPHREDIHCLVNVSDSLFASGSIDGTIILWTTHILAPSRYFNSMLDYHGPQHMFPYSVQCIVPIDERYICAAIGCGFAIFDAATGKCLVEKQKAHYSKILHLGFVWNSCFLATCSEDGSVRLWGRAGVSTDMQTMDSQYRGTMSKFTGLSVDELRAHKGQGHIDIQLLGECLGHSGPVGMCLDFGSEGIVTCGKDNLVIVWKNAELQSMHRTDLIREMLLGVPGVI